MDRTESVHHPTATYAELVLDPDTWFRQAKQFFLTAKALDLRAATMTPRSADSNALSVGRIKVTLLLMALSLENALKGVRARQGAIEIKGGRIITQSFGGGRSGHDLTLLAAAGGIQLNVQETELLKRLTKVLLWAGRYQQPLTELEHLSASAENPRTLSYPHDIRMVDRLIDRAQKGEGP